MLFINATLSKNQQYKPKNQINKVPTISKQDDIELFSSYFSGADPAFVIRGGPNSEHLLSNLRKLLK